MLRFLLLFSVTGSVFPGHCQSPANLWCRAFDSSASNKALSFCGPLSLLAFSGIRHLLYIIFVTKIMYSIFFFFAAALTNAGDYV